MITHLGLRNFKCFEHLRLPMRHLTLLCGMNASGKSSVIQALLVLRQSYDQGLLSSTGLALNGDLTQLGTGRDVLWEGAATEEISIELEFEDEQLASWTCGYDSLADVLPYRVGTSSALPAVPPTALFLGPFQYLRAERLGPRVQSGLSRYVVHQRRSLGIGAEFVAHFLDAHGREPVVGEARMRRNHGEGTALREQVERWMDRVAPGVRIETEPFANIDAIAVRYRFPLGKVGTLPYRATNVGFGISYVLGVVVALLATPPGGLVLLENPEAHLHPSAQSELGNLAARAAACGVQVVVETHSDHVLNGIRRTVFDGVLHPARLSIGYFTRDRESGASQVTNPKVDRRGRIDTWPSGFFDEWEKNLEVLLGEPPAHEEQ